MKKHSERQPIDDLFARKFKNMSLPPTANGFDRLQARMQQNKPETRIVFWHNPVVQRYMAAAACLLLVCLFGWLYKPSETRVTFDRPQIATNQHTPLRVGKAVDKRPNEPTKETISSEVTQVSPGPEQLAQVEKKAKSSKTVSPTVGQPTHIDAITSDLHQSMLSGHNESAVAQTKTATTKVSSETISSQSVTPANTTISDQVVAIDRKITSTPEPTAERVLVVTIDEPATLVAARQAVKASIDEKVVVDNNDKAAKDPKHGGLWQQVKRIKEGEIFARRDNADNDERGLLSRAYNGLKHSLDKDKSTKQ